MEALPGADALVRHLAASRVPLAICTSSAADEFEVKTRRLRHWLDLIPVRVLAGSDQAVRRGKPHPDPYLVTLGRLSPPAASADRCLVFEDSVNGCKSALAAGMRCIMIPQRKFIGPAMQAEIEQLRPQLTDLLWSMADFKPEQYGLPPLPK